MYTEAPRLTNSSLATSALKLTFCEKHTRDNISVRFSVLFIVTDREYVREIIAGERNLPAVSAQLAHLKEGSCVRRVPDPQKTASNGRTTRKQIIIYVQQNSTDVKLNKTAQRSLFLTGYMPILKGKFYFSLTDIAAIFGRVQC